MREYVSSRVFSDTRRTTVDVTTFFPLWYTYAASGLGVGSARPVFRLQTVYANQFDARLLSARDHGDFYPELPDRQQVLPPADQSGDRGPRARSPLGERGLRTIDGALQQSDDADGREASHRA